MCVPFPSRMALDMPFPRPWPLPKPAEVRFAQCQACFPVLHLRLPSRPTGRKLNASGPRHPGVRKAGLWLEGWAHRRSQIPC